MVATANAAVSWSTPTLTQPALRGQVVDPVGDRLAQRPGRGSRGRLTRSGSPLGCHSRPPFLKSPTSSFFLVSTEMTGCPAAWKAATCVVDVAELGVAVGVRAALQRLAVGLEAVPRVVQQLGDRPVADRWPRPVSAAASWRVLLQVHRSGDSGSPRVTGSTRRSRAAASVGSPCRLGLRPPRAGGPGPRAPLSSSSTPRVTVDHATPVARATSVIPPRPCLALPPPSTARRPRSSSTGDSSANLRDTSLSRSAAVTTSHRVRQKSRT